MTTRFSMVLSLVLGSVACSSHTCSGDRTEERSFQDWERLTSNAKTMDVRTRVMASNDDASAEMAQARTLFAHKYQGRVQPGIGCDVCPELCDITDLRPMPVSEFQDSFRRSVSGRTVGDWVEQLDYLELLRLSCIVQGGSSEVRVGALALLGPDEPPIVRWHAAVMAIEHSLDPTNGWETIRELAHGSDSLAQRARNALEQSKSGILPSL